jgi:hypothetical protein
VLYLENENVYVEPNGVIRDADESTCTWHVEQGLRYVRMIATLHPDELIRVINFCGKRTIRWCVKKARQIAGESPIRTLRRNLCGKGTNLKTYLKISYGCGINPLPALRELGINVKWGKISSNDITADVAVYYRDGNVCITYPTYRECRVMSEKLEQIYRSKNIEECKKKGVYTDKCKCRVVHKKVVRVTEEE